MSGKGKRKQKRLSHEEIRPRVCFVCRRKADFTGSRINDEYKRLVDIHVCRDVPWDDCCIPCGLCRSCRRNLNRWEEWTEAESEDRGPVPTMLPAVADFRDVVIFPPQTRAAAQADCECLICQVFYPGGLGKISPLSVTSVGEDKGGRRKKRRTEDERLDATIQCTPPQPESMCPTCKKRGVEERDGHECTLAALTRNTLALVEENPVVKERVVSSILKTLPKSPGGTIRLSQAAGGRKAPVSLGKAPEPQPSTSCSVDAMATIQQTRHLPMKGVKEVRAILNADAGKRVVEPNLVSKLNERVKRLEHHFIKQSVTIKGAVHEIHHVKDLNAFIDDVAEMRGVDRSKCLIRLSMDSGGGSLKLDMNLIDLTADRFKSNPEKRKKRRIGEYLDSGVQKILHLAVCDDLEESHESIAAFLRITHVREAMKVAKANGEEFCLAPDLKVANFAAGIMSHSSNHPCCWCNAKKDKLELIGAETRTFRRIRDRNQRRRLLTPSSNWDYAKNEKYENCVFNPVIGEDDERVIDVIVPGELHILMGVTMLILDMIEEVWSEEGMEKWYTELGIQKRPYRGGTFPGNDCKLITSEKAIEQLYELTLRDGVFLQVQPLANTLAALDEVSSKCFSNVLADDWQESIQRFEDSFVKLGRAWTPKVHALVFHVPEFIRSRNRALGPYSEQTGESLHHVWKEYVKERFSKLPRGKFPDPTLHALVRFNAEHI